MNTEKLTKRTVDAARRRDKEWLLPDREIPGFGLRVHSSGRKVYVYRYRSSDGVRRRVKIGQHGPLTAEAARRRALEIAGEVAAGQDPAGEAVARKNAPRVCELAERFLAEHVRVLLKARSMREYERIIDRYILPKIGNRRVREVSSRDIEAILASMSNTPVMANRVRAVGSSMFGFAERPAVGLRDPGTNPTQGSTRRRESRRVRSFSDVELKGVLDGLATVEREGANPGAVAALRLSLLLGWRISECLALRWEDVDLESRTAVLRDAKAGTRTARLSAPACRIIADAPQLGAVLAPGRDPLRPVDYKVAYKIWRQACEISGVENAQIHDCRRSIATRLANDNVGAAVIQAVLGHSTPTMALRYVADASSAAGTAVEMYGERIESLMMPDRRRSEGAR